MILQVQICTLGAAGIERVSKMDLPRLKDVSYLICFQNPGGDTFPSILASRSDVSLIETVSRGLSHNRNTGLTNTEADIVLFADDDLVFNPEGLVALKERFEENPSMAFAAFARTGGDAKVFPAYEFCLSGPWPRGYYVSSVELAVRPALIGGHKFSTNFGLGAPVFGSGEEEVFVYCLRHKGLEGRYFPIAICEHPGESTGHRKPPRSVLRAFGAIARLQKGSWRGLLRVIRTSSLRHTCWLRAFIHQLHGYLIMPRYLNPDGSDKN